MVVDFFANSNCHNSTFSAPKQMNYRHTYLARNALKLAYGDLGPNKFSGVKPKEPRPRSRLTRPGRGASNAGRGLGRKAPSNAVG